MRHGQAKLLDPVADLIAVEAQQGPRSCLVAAAASQGLRYQASLESFEIDTRRGQLELVAGSRLSAECREIAGIETVTVRQQHRSFDDVAKFPHVAGPPVAS